MKLYKLPVVLLGPNEDTEDKYLAEVPILPGCRAWGDTVSEVMENIQSVATAFIQSYKDRGYALPPEVEAASQEVLEPPTTSEMLVVA